VKTINKNFFLKALRPKDQQCYKVFADLIMREFAPTSVLDYGCGTGHMLYMLWKRGLIVKGFEMSKDIVGITPKEFLPHIDFRSVGEKIDVTDLGLPKRFDFVVCLEVAEHLPAENADMLVENVCRHTDRVLFSAATPGQGGWGHINEQPFEYWLKKFNVQGFSLAETMSENFREELRRANVYSWYSSNARILYRHTVKEPRMSLVDGITLALSTRNDLQGLYFTIHSALLNVHNTPLQGKLRFSVVNNSDDPVQRTKINNHCRKYRLPYEISSTFSNHHGRNLAVRNSKTKYTVLADSHILFTPGFFEEYYRILSTKPEVGLIHSPFTSKGGIPNYKSNCFYNMAKFHKNLHGSFSYKGALVNDIYRVALSPHAAYGFRTDQWLGYGGYNEKCMGHGGGEPFVTFKYWMFGSSAWLTPKVGFIHYTGDLYKKGRYVWRKNHTITAAALGGYEVGVRYAKFLKTTPEIEEIWSIARPLHEQILKRSVVPFDKLIDHFKRVKARPWR